MAPIPIDWLAALLEAVPTGACGGTTTAAWVGWCKGWTSAGVEMADMIIFEVGLSRDLRDREKGQWAVEEGKC